MFKSDRLVVINVDVAGGEGLRHAEPAAAALPAEPMRVDASQPDNLGAAAMEGVEVQPAAPKPEEAAAQPGAPSQPQGPLHQPQF